MNKYRKLIFAIGLLLPLSMSASDYPWLTFKMLDNTEISVVADNLLINYSNDALHLKSATVDQSFLLAQIQSMRFTSASSGISDVSAVCAENAEFFTVSGVKVGQFASVDDARKALPAGMYVVKTEKKSLKVIF